MKAVAKGRIHTIEAKPGRLVDEFACWAIFSVTIAMLCLAAYGWPVVGIPLAMLAAFLLFRVKRIKPAQVVMAAIAAMNIYAYPLAGSLLALCWLLLGLLSLYPEGTAASRQER